MNEKNETAVQIIENATREDVCPGDHITWKWVQEFGGATIKSSHEGIAHHRDGDGNWWTEDGMWLTDREGEGTALTIRRHAEDLPTKPGAGQ